MGDKVTNLTNVTLELMPAHKKDTNKNTTFFRSSIHWFYNFQIEIPGETSVTLHRLVAIYSHISIRTICLELCFDNEDLLNNFG